MSSNLIKRNYIYFDHKEKRVIDSNDRADAYIPAPAVKKADEDRTNGEFISGLNAINIDVENILKEQNEIASSMAVTEAASGEAEEILRQARSQADELLEEARAQAELLKTQAYEEGKQQGYLEGSEECNQKAAQLELEFQEKILANERDYEQHLLNLEPDFVDIMIALIEKITGVMVEDKKDVILYLLDRTMKQETKSNQFMIRVSKEDYEFLESQKERLYSSVGNDAQIQVEEDRTLGKNQCILETDTKIIDCSLDIQLKNLCDDLKLLSRI